MPDLSNLKKAAAEKAVDSYVEDGMTVGLGTGSTAYFAILRVGELVAQGYKLRCVATSQQTEDIARQHGIEIADIDSVDSIDVTIDGADEIDPHLNLIKGLGGALLREKIVAAATVAEVIMPRGWWMRGPQENKLVLETALRKAHKATERVVGTGVTLSAPLKAAYPAGAAVASEQPTPGAANRY